MKDKNWKELYSQDIDTIRELDTLREQGTERIKNLFESYNQQFPQQFKNLNKGFKYLEDLHFSFNLTQKKFKHLVIAKATVSNPNLVSRNDLNFGFIEILNRYKFVETYKLNKINFYITAFIRMLYLITNILHLNTSWILRFFGNLKGIISCIILDINKKIN